MEFANILTRKEMKFIKGGSNPNWSCECSTDECDVIVEQYSSHWTMVVDCGEGPANYGNSGCWGGSACGGACIAVC